MTHVLDTNTRLLHNINSTSKQQATTQHTATDRKPTKQLWDVGREGGRKGTGNEGVEKVSRTSVDEGIGRSEDSQQRQPTSN